MNLIIIFCLFILVNFEITNSDFQEDNSENEYDQEQETNISNPKKRARKQLLTARLAAALVYVK